MAVGPPGNGHHGGDHVVGHRLLDASLACVVLSGNVEQHLALGVDHFFDEVRTVVDARRRDGGVGRCHVDDARLVLTQHDPGARGAAESVLGEGVLHAGEAFCHTGSVGGIGHILRTVLQLQHQSVIDGVERAFECLGDAAGAATLALGVVDRQRVVDLQWRAIHLVTQPHALLECSHQSEDLE